jgi:hypothetical protein
MNKPEIVQLDYLNWRRTTRFQCLKHLPNPIGGVIAIGIVTVIERAVIGEDREVGL